jgi:hypothetical protein
MPMMKCYGVGRRLCPSLRMSEPGQSCAAANISKKVFLVNHVLRNSLGPSFTLGISRARSMAFEAIETRLTAAFQP